MDKEKIKNILIKKMPENQVFIDEPMSKHTSFKIGGNADFFIKIKNIDQLIYVINIAKENGINITVIGNGSNILVKDNGIRGMVLKIEIDNISIQRYNLSNKVKNLFTKDIATKDIDISAFEKIVVNVGAGVKNGTLAQKLAKENVAGFEFAAGIPGTIGGAVKMNAGAYGGEMSDIVFSTTCLDLEDFDIVNLKSNIDDIEMSEPKNITSLAVITLNNEEQKFSYRHSIFMEKKYIILETKLLLNEGNYKDIKAKMDENLSSRAEKQPLQMPSAGSTFKRGEDFITAKIIDECGLKGYSIGGAQVSEKHAGFIVNTGNATAQDVIDLINYVKETVHKKTGKKIELEIEILGD